MIKKPTYEELEKRIQELEHAESERKRTFEALKESEERLKVLSEASFEVIFLSEEGICLDQNQAAERIFGYSRAEAVGRHGTECIIPEDR
jgi:PAS domain-containing protein